MPDKHRTNWSMAANKVNASLGLTYLPATTPMADLAQPSSPSALSLNGSLSGKPGSASPSSLDFDGSGSERMPLGLGARRNNNPDKAAAAKLPEEAVERRRRLVEIKQENHTLYMNISEDIGGARTQLANVQHSLDKYVRELGKPDETVNKDANVKSKRDEIKWISDRISRLQSRAAPYAAIVQALAAVLNSIDQYIYENSSDKLTTAKVPTIGKNDTVASLTAKIEAFLIDLLEIDSRGWPSDDVKRRMIAEIDFVASFGKIGVTGSLDYRGQLEWPSLSDREIDIRGYGRRDQNGRPDAFDVGTVSVDSAIAVWANRDAIVKKLSDEIDELADDDRALSAEDRAGRIAAILGSLLAEQRRLAEIILRDAAHDQWPHDIDPRAVLGIDGPAPRQD